MRSIGWRILGLLLAGGFGLSGCRVAPDGSAAPPASDPPPPETAHEADPLSASTARDPVPIEGAAAPAEEPAPASAREFEVPAGWESLTNLAFERAVDEWLPAGEVRQASEATLADLRRALSGLDVVAMRAAVMLARTRDPRAGEVLLARLEERAAPPPGESQRDAADVVAAAAFGAGMSTREAAARLNGLAIGRRPHPSLSVRVECARGAIALGRDDPIPFLLTVLRAGTTAGRVVGADESVDDLAWAQVRAAEALAARAGTKSRFLPEGSMRDREEEAARLESLLPPPRKR